MPRQPRDTQSRLQSMDSWVASHPMLPRMLPYMVYVVLLSPVAMATEKWLWAYAPLYAVQCLVVSWMLWRYRKLTPELTCSFHWLALPTGILVAVLWVISGKLMVAQWPEWFAAKSEHPFATMSEGILVPSITLRIVGMSVLVPLFEELFIRSLLLRTFNRFKSIGIGVVQLACDTPILGDWLMNTNLAQRALVHGSVLQKTFESTPLGRLSITGVSVSTALFALGHHIRDWPAAVACGVIYCLLLSATARKGLGPVVWAHGITNLLLMGYSLQTGDWQFL